MNFLNIILISSALIGFTSAKSSFLPNCPSDAQELYIPHETDCSLYYVCSFGSITLIACPDGLHFNPSAKYCDYPANAGCELVGSTTTEIDTTIFTTDSTAPDTTTEFWTTGSTPPDSTAPDTTTEFWTTTDYPTSSTEWQTDGTTMKPTCGNSDFPLIPHETDCNKFYVCVDGFPNLLLCKEGLEFDYYLQRCVEISNNGCTASQS